MRLTVTVDLTFLDKKVENDEPDRFAERHYS